MEILHSKFCVALQSFLYMQAGVPRNPQTFWNHRSPPRDLLIYETTLTTDYLVAGSANNYMQTKWVEGKVLAIGSLH